MYISSEALLSGEPTRSTSYGALSLALEHGLAALRMHGRRLARAFDLGAGIDLPDLGETSSTLFDANTLAPLAPLYLAWEMERAGLLLTAELIAGLYASGAIQQPLGPASAPLHQFWKARAQRLAAQEREALLAQVFDAAAFEPRMQRLCTALVAMADNAGGRDVREEVGLTHAGLTLLEAVAPSISGMATFAAGDIIESITLALRFMKERSLQLAFGVRDLWGLMEVANRTQGVSAATARDAVERGRNGATVLGWLARQAGQGVRLEPADAQAQLLFGAAQRWLLAQSVPGQAAGATPVLPP